MDRKLLKAAYDRSAEGYDERFRDLQRAKFRGALPHLQPLFRGAACLDAGGGTALFSEWLATGEAPQLTGGRWVVLDLSVGMLRLAKAREPMAVAADLARPPLKPGAFQLVTAFTSILDEADRALDALAALVAPGGELCVSFLADEAPSRLWLRGLRCVAGPVEAGQDKLFVLRKDLQ